MTNAVIAIIDDDELVRNSTSSLLRSLGYKTALYESANAFLGAPVQHLDCILSDLQMPGCSGLDLRATLKAQGSTVPMILMTAFPTSGAHAQAKALDMIALLEKPLDADHLADALTEALT